MRVAAVHVVERVLALWSGEAPNLNGCRTHHVGVTTGLDFAEFFAATWPRLLRTTYAVTGDAQLAEDALQAAFTQAYASWARVVRADDPVAYVRRIAVNAALQHGRRAFVRREVSRADVPETVAPAVGEVDEVWQLVRSLPPRQRAVVVLRYYEDLSEQQIAQTLGCRPGTVKSQASAALSTLRTQLRAQSWAEPGSQLSEERVGRDGG